MPKLKTWDRTKIWIMLWVHRHGIPSPLARTILQGGRTCAYMRGVMGSFSKWANKQTTISEKTLANPKKTWLCTYKRELLHLAIAGHSGTESLILWFPPFFQLYSFRTHLLSIDSVRALRCVCFATYHNLLLANHCLWAYRMIFSFSLVIEIIDHHFNNYWCTRHSSSIGQLICI